MKTFSNVSYYRYFTCKIKVRENRSGNQERTIQRNWQHTAHNTKKNKTKTQHNTCRTPLCANEHK